MSDSNPEESLSPAEIQRDKNLAPYRWKPGQSGNPSGRPKSKVLSEVTHELLEEKLTNPEFRTEFKDALWKRLLSDRVAGSMTLREIWDRLEGKVRDEIELSVSEGFREVVQRARERVSKAELGSTPDLDTRSLPDLNTGEEQ
jgi:hypothetical protein